MTDRAFIRLRILQAARDLEAAEATGGDRTLPLWHLSNALVEALTAVGFRPNEMETVIRLLRDAPELTKRGER